MAQRRCLMVLSVLSGERPVTSVVEELGLSRGTYYKLEMNALLAMLRALAPGADAHPEAATAAGRMAELEARVARLEQEKRRLERLLYLTRKVVPPGPVTTPRRGRPLGRRSTTRGRRPSTPSMRTMPPASASPPSTPTTDGATTR